MPRTRTLLYAALAVMSPLAACSGGGADGGIGASAAQEAACPLLARLSSAGDVVAGADVADPVAFGRALDDAVADYISTLDALVAVVPDKLSGDLESLRGAVEQLRFDDAIAARSPIDSWAADSCGKTAGA